VDYRTRLRKWLKVELSGRSDGDQAGVQFDVAESSAGTTFLPQRLIDQYHHPPLIPPRSALYTMSALLGICISIAAIATLLILNLKPRRAKDLPPGPGKFCFIKQAGH
jgi:hypothetical protein